MAPNTTRIEMQVIDSHTEGEPTRLVVAGGPPLGNGSLSERKALFARDFDHYRVLAANEPRGYDAVVGALLCEPVDRSCAAGLIFFNNTGYLGMCGHGTIGTVTAAIEAGLIQPKTPGKLILDVPAGQIQVSYRQQGDKVLAVKLINVPSYLAIADARITVPGLGELTVDVAYGGNFYAIVEPQANFPGLEHWSADKVLHFSPLLREALNRAYQCQHPLNPSINGISHVLWTGKPKTAGSDGANAVFYGDGAIDRSPCGTGTSARMAQWYAKGLLKKGDEFIHESIIGSRFIGRIEEETAVNGKPAMRPSIEGWAKIYGHNTISIDIDDDPYAHGFQVI